MAHASVNLPTWEDPKRWLWLFSPFVPFIALAAFGLYFLTGWGVLLWLGPVLVYGIIPLADKVIGTDLSNPPEDAIPDLEKDNWYRNIVISYVPMQWGITIVAAWLFAHGGLAMWEIIGMAFSVGAVNGIAINTAHELGHKKSALERWAAKFSLAPVAYGHFFVEHNRGHHVHVATPADPASSRMGETFWQFLPRTMIGGLKSSWNIEKKRLARRGKSAWSLENDNLQAWALTVVMYGALAAWLGWPVLIFLAAQAFYGASLLEVVNYLEHYGLLRKKREDGRYERCEPCHSWNSNHVVTNLFLYQLQRHSDHHANPTRRFQALRHFDDSPQLPSGYASMLIPAYIPSLWFKIMDPLVVAHYNGDITQAHLYPPARERLLRKWGQADAVVTGNDVARTSAETTTSTVVAESANDQHDKLCDCHAFQCPNCNYVYEEAEGCPSEGFEPGTAWSAIPDNWACPDCAVRDKVDFTPISAEDAHAAADSTRAANVA